MYALKLFVVLLFVSLVSSGLVGGYYEKDSNDSECLDFANKAMAKQNAAENGNRAIQSIDHCATQVVAGTNFKIDANVCDVEGETFKACTKCNIKLFRPLQSYDVEVNNFQCEPLVQNDQ